MTPLRFALLLGEGPFAEWHGRCLDQLAPFAELVGVVATPGVAAPERLGPLLRAYARRVELAPATEVSSRLDVPRLSADDACRLDFVLKLGGGPLPTAIPAARLGLWYFEHEVEASVLPFFREACAGEDVIRLALCAVRGSDQGHVLLQEGFLRTDGGSYTRTRDVMLDAVAPWPARICRRHTASIESDARPLPAPAPMPRERARSTGLPSYAVSVIAHRIALAWERLFRQPQWNIGLLRRPIEALLAPGGYRDEEIEWLEQRGRASFLADPFGIDRDGSLQILCERFDYREARGHICTLEWPPASPGAPPVEVMSPPSHVSYPFLIEDGGEVYCVPETSGTWEIALFRADEFPYRWSRAGVLIEGFPGIDPTVFRHDGRWWLMATHGRRLPDAELWAWHAAALSGPWIAHEGNPIKTDVRGARPAGKPFVVAGELYRPAQDCSKRYGWRIGIQRVKRLTPTEFEEEPVAIVEPSPTSPYPAGRHTLTPVGDVVLIDGHRSVFVWRAALAFLSIWLSSAASRNAGSASDVIETPH